MILVRTPFRVSLFGGGTDIPEWFRYEGGQVLSSTIDKYCYVSARELPPFFGHSIRVAYSRVETVSSTAAIRHPLVRVILQDMNVDNIEIHYDSDLPGYSGLGTSSSFGVGLVVALSGLKGALFSSQELADKVIHYERVELNEFGGFQDQIAAAFGGFNHISFDTDGSYSVHPIPLSAERLLQLKDSLLLCYVPITRLSSEVSLAKDFDRRKHESKLRFIYGSVSQALQILMQGDLSDLGELLHESWCRKREFDRVSNPTIDEMYRVARSAGATGGKILGAGGGGFFLFFCLPERRAAVKLALGETLFVPFEFEKQGAQIIYFNKR